MVEINKVHLGILIVQIIIAFFSLSITSYFLSENLKIAQSQQRANLSIIGEEQHSITDGMFNMSYSGHIRNEGSRVTLIKSIEFRLFYSIGKGFSQSFNRIYDEPAELGWSNFIFVEEQSRSFLIDSFVNSEDVQISEFREPDYCSIYVIHDDGEGLKEEIIELDF